MLEAMRITKPFKTLARVTELFCLGRYNGDQKTAEVIELNLIIEGGYAEEVKEFLEKTESSEKQQTITITVVP